jgi:hypothetical protein
VLLGNGDGTFSLAWNIRDYAFSVSVGDFDGDGRPDLAVAHYDPFVVSVRINNTP